MSNYEHIKSRKATATPYVYKSSDYKLWKEHLARQQQIPTMLQHSFTDTYRQKVYDDVLAWIEAGVDVKNKILVSKHHAID